MTSQDFILKKTQFVLLEEYGNTFVISIYFSVIKCRDSPSPCLRGVCKDIAAGFVCECPSKYLGKTCDTRK